METVDPKDLKRLLAREQGGPAQAEIGFQSDAGERLEPVRPRRPRWTKAKEKAVRERSFIFNTWCEFNLFLARSHERAVRDGRSR